MEGWHAEIRDLHKFFEDWFNGFAADRDDVFDRLRTVLDPGFVLVGPDGIVRKRSEVVHAIYREHGARTIRIWIENPELVAEAEDWRVARYLEWQAREGEAPKGRISTAVLRRDPAAPNGWIWLAVQETWLPR